MIRRYTLGFILEVYFFVKWGMCAKHGFLGKNMCKRSNLRQMFIGKSRICVSEAVHETDFQRNKRKMCVRGPA